MELPATRAPKAVHQLIVALVSCKNQTSKQFNQQPAVVALLSSKSKITNQKSEIKNMSDSLDGFTISGALQNREEMRRWMRAVNRNLLLHRNMLDAFPLSGIADDPSVPVTVRTPPPPVDFIVIGTDGQFQVTITLPQDAQPLSVTLLQQSVLSDTNPLQTPMVHQLQSATSVLFDSAAGVTTYGPFSELTQTFQLPNQTLFWRIRSSFDGSNWNEWQLYGSVPTAASWLPATNYVAGATVVPTEA